MVDLRRERDRLLKACRSFVRDFESDFVLDGAIVCDPDGRWSPLTCLYREAKAAVEAAEPGKRS